MLPPTFFSYLNPFFLAKYARPANLMPDLELNSVADLDVKDLKQRGIKAVIFDVDNTLCGLNSPEIDETLKPKIQELSENFSCCILSNTSSAKRMTELKQNFPLPVADAASKKPKKEAFDQALKLTGSAANETAMVGDLLLTDVAGANNAGLVSIKVRPFKPESQVPGMGLVRLAEATVLRIHRIIY